MRRMLAIVALVGLSIVPVAAGTSLSHGRGLADGGTTGPTPLVLVKKVG